MQQWEYLLFSEVNKANNAIADYYQVNGTQYEYRYELSYDKNFPSIEQKFKLLNELGTQGWELIAVNGSEHLFKRPKS